MQAIRRLLFALCLLVPAHAYPAYGNDNPFVEAMLRMMAMFGLIDRYQAPLSFPYAAGIGGMSGLGGHPGAGMLPGMSPMSPWNSVTGGGMPGMGQFPASGGWPGATFPGATGTPPANWPSASRSNGQIENLDGIWELENGSFVIIRGHAARLFLNQDRSQDFVIGYDGRTFWWSPRGGNTTTRYRYQERDGRMVLRDNDDKVLLMRRRN